MVESSENYQASGKPHTSKTASLTADQSLQILQQAVINCQQAGIEIKVATMHPGDNALMLVFEGVVLADNRFILAKDLPAQAKV